MSTAEIGKRIKQAREAKHITQEKLGNYLGLNKSSIQRYETGKVEKIKLPILENIALILDVNPSWLALKTDDPQNHFTGSASSVELTADEKKLVDAYRSFNAEGKEEALKRLSEMSQLDQYKKCDSVPEDVS